MTLSVLLTIIIGFALLALGAFGCWCWLKLVARCIDRHERIKERLIRERCQRADAALSDYKPVERSPMPVHDTEGGCYEPEQNKGGIQ